MLIRNELIEVSSIIMIAMNVSTVTLIADVLSVTKQPVVL